jgi:peroxiredoxin
MTLSKNKSLPKIILLLVVPVLALSVIFWHAGLLNASEKDLDGETLEHNRIDSLFKKLGIIRLSGIAPPVEIKLVNINGEIVNVSDFKGKVVFLNFWTTWCPDCRVEMPEMEKLFIRFKEDDFVMVTINLRESSKKVSAFFKKHKLTFHALLDSDGSVGTAFGVRSIPTTFILDKQGGLLGKAMGSRKWGGRKAAELFQILIRSERSSVDLYK